MLIVKKNCKVDYNYMKVWKVYLRFKNEKLRFEIIFLKFNI